MAIDEKIKNIVNADDSLKIIASVSKEGIPHASVKQTLHYDSNVELLEFYELIESSISNQNLVYSLWNDKKVSIQVVSSEKESYELLAIPKKAIVSGRKFENAYKEVRDIYGDVDLSTIWQLEIVEIKDESLHKRQLEEETKHPIIKHIDRVLK